MVSPFEWAEQVEPAWSWSDADRAVNFALGGRFGDTFMRDGHTAWGKAKVVDRVGHKAVARFHYYHYEAVVRARALEEARALAEIEASAMVAS